MSTQHAPGPSNQEKTNARDETQAGLTGQSVLYLVDTVNQHLAVYQANGGASGTQGIRLVGARNIALDLALDGFNDKTEANGRPLTYKDLEKEFAKNDLLPDCITAFFCNKLSPIDRQPNSSCQSAQLRPRLPAGRNPLAHRADRIANPRSPRGCRAWRERRAYGYGRRPHRQS